MGLFAGLIAFVMATYLKGKETLTNLLYTLLGSTIFGVIIDIILPIIMMILSGGGLQGVLTTTVDIITLVLTNLSYSIGGFIGGELLMYLKEYLKV